ncbi:MAG: 50S ribosomal protein L10 [Candidatus Pacebacteria bacterium]|nr:50S ribosomal protein L10 [Candidatus Paceibacterota bacterium]
MPSQYNQQQVELIKEKLAQAKSVTIINYSGTNVNDQVKLRAAVKQAGGEVFVTKNTLMKLAFEQPELAESLQGMNALVFSYEDAVAALKAVYEFHQETDKLEIKQGLMADKVLTLAEVDALSKLPNKDELIITLIHRIKAPGNGLVNVLNANIRDLVQVLKAVSEQEA